MPSLPIHACLDDICRALSEHNDLVLEAPPGAGKTTLVPLELLKQPWMAQQKILLLEPRRIAARNAAQRLADNLGEAVGETVGYRMRLDSKVSQSTRIEVVTEGVLARYLQDDPSLDGVGLLIFDEFHERSLDADTGLALALQGRELFGDDRQRPLKILVMSATLDGDRVAQLLQGAPVVRSEGRAYPVDIRFGDAYRYDQRLDDRVVATIEQALQDEQGSLLVFLPGVGEIRRTAERLSERLAERLAERSTTHNNDVMITPLYGDLSLAQQQQAIQPAPAGKRKVVLATSIAESSLTIEGVRVVIDAGLSREPAFDPNTGLTRLHTKRVSKASAEQRCGRAGRTQAGVCYRLWSKQQHDELAAKAPAEIINADLAPLAMQLLLWGCDEPAELRWLDPPSPAAYAQAINTLQLLGVVASDGTQLTVMGQRAAHLSVHPRLAAMMLRSAEWQQLELGCQLAAVLSERDASQMTQVDLADRIELLTGQVKASHQQKGWQQRVGKLAQQYQRQLKRVSSADGVTKVPSATSLQGLLLASAYPDRIALKRQPNGHQYHMANGRAAELPEGDRLAKQAAIVVAAAGGMQGRRQDKVFLAAALNVAEFKHYFADYLQPRTHIDWDDHQGKLIAEERLYMGQLVLEKTLITKPCDEARQQALLDLVQRRGLSLFENSDEVQQWRARVQLMAQLDDKQQASWPDVSDQGLLNSVELWLAPYLSQISKLDDFRRLPWLTALKTLLPWDLQQRLNQQLPERLSVPSGSSAAIDYTQQPPVLAVKLQEMFGCVSTPTVADGRVSLLLHLLSPARRPLQITQDLRGFWEGSYQQVKKDMKGRYPKHPWPDDPLQALPTAKTKRHLSP